MGGGSVALRLGRLFRASEEGAGNNPSSASISARDFRRPVVGSTRLLLGVSTKDLLDMPVKLFRGVSSKLFRGVSSKLFRGVSSKLFLGLSSTLLLGVSTTLLLGVSVKLFRGFDMLAKPQWEEDSQKYILSCLKFFLISLQLAQTKT